MQRLFARLAILAVGFSFAVAGEARAQNAAAAAGAVTETADTKVVPYGGLAFDFTIADGSGLNGVGQNYRNDLAFYFEPTWNFGARFLAKTRFKTMALAARFILNQNLSGTDEGNFGGQTTANPQGTCSNLTPGQGGTIDPTQVRRCNPGTANRRADYSDVWLTLRWPRAFVIPKINVGINPSLRFILPSSLQSQFASLQVSITPAVGFNGSWWKSRIRAGYQLGVNKFIHKYSTSGIQANDRGDASAQGGNAWEAINGTGISNFFLDPSRVGTTGALNPNFSIAQTFSAGLQFHPKVGLDIFYIYVMTYPLQPSSCIVEVQGQIVDTCRTGDAVAANSGSRLSRPARRDSQVLWVSLNYQALDWMSVALSWINWSPAQKPDSSYRQGFISTDYNAFTTVQLGLTFTIDELATAIRKKVNKGSTQNQAAIPGRNLW